jgi:flagellar motility protein MotE (MotC chaperone)
MKAFSLIFAVSALMSGAIACSAPVTTREMGAAVGTVGGVAAGGEVGSAEEQPGASFSDRLQAFQEQQLELDKQIKQIEQELQRQREDLEQLEKETKQR